MKFSCERLLLLTAILTASRVVASKSPVPELEGLLIAARDGNVRISGYDLKTGITTAIDADVEEPGSIVLKSQLFCEIVRKLPSGFVTVTVSDGYLTKIESGMSEFNILGASSHNFPELPILDTQVSVAIPGGVLKDMITQTNFAVSDNESRPVHTGALFEISGGAITIVAVDGYRLALRHETAESGLEDTIGFVVPGAALSEVEKISSGQEEQIRISLGSKHVMFSIEDTTLISRRLEGEFLDYKNAIPKEGKYTVTADRRTLIEAVERVSLIINDKQKSPLRCTFGDGVLKMQAVSTLGRAHDECPVEGDAEEMEIGFNDRFLLEALRAAPADEISIRLSSGITPCLILPTDESGRFVYMILPVRLRANES
ncbi:MAG: DNA polymerase III subunit beta [Oscillospiraceae bacterium]|jgi:DNA polymerase-3 subunit beta|nr:DNA polymerase III subunit beta [Oscillospiraceae bacterium]